MKFGVTLLADDLGTLSERARLAEEIGYDYIGVADSQSLFRELYVSLTVVAQVTNRARIGTAVTNPLTRHPAVTSSAIASIDELSNGRAFLGIGSGDSAVLNLDLRPARLAQVKEYVQAVRTHLTGKSYSYQGRDTHVRWANSSAPILMAAEGPRTLKLAGEIADAVLVHTGLTPEILESSIAMIREGEDEAGKPQGSVEIWAFAKCNVADDRDEAMQEIKMALAASGHHAFRYTLEGKHVPEELHESVAVLQREYEPMEHEQLGHTRNATLSDELGLTDFLADRFAVVGTPAECREKVAAIAKAGIDVLLATAIGPKPDVIIERFGRGVAALSD